MTLGTVAAAGLLVVGIAALQRHSAPERPTKSANLPHLQAALSSPIRIESFEVERFRGNTTDLVGTLGLLTFFAVAEDNVIVTARLNGPAYCYLIALNPDAR